jgi:exonuclease VII large subunit
MRQAEDRAARMEGMLAAQQQARPQPQPTGPVYVAPEQLQALVDQGRITPMQAADILSKQNAQAAATQTTMQAVQLQGLATKLQAAKNEVDQYIAKVPSLRDNTSQDFQRVAEEAYRLSEDMNLPVTDFRVQRAALRAAYGSLEKIAATQQARQQSRDASLPHVETRTGGRPAQTAAGNGADPLKDVDPTYIQFWERRGYTREQMIDEAQYIPKGRKVRPAAAR